MKHYVYRLDDPITKEFYIGSRSCKTEIENDKYLGSYYTWKPKNKQRLVKTILKSNFNKKELAISYEATLIKENIDNPLNRNYHIPNKGFHTLGKKCSNETRKKLSDAIRNMPDEYRDRIRKNHIDVGGNKNPFFGKTHTDETKLNHSEFMKEYYQNNKHQLLGIPRTDEIKSRLSNIMKSQPTIDCPYCDAVGKRLSMYRWHFDNCKFKI
jgi:hypothetical protein